MIIISYNYLIGKEYSKRKPKKIPWKIREWLYFHRELLYNLLYKKSEVEKKNA